MCKIGYIGLRRRWEGRNPEALDHVPLVLVAGRQKGERGSSGSPLCLYRGPSHIPKGKAFRPIVSP